MTSAYDWMKEAREQNNFQNGLERVFKEQGNDNSLFSNKNWREKDFLMRKMICIST